MEEPALSLKRIVSVDCVARNIPVAVGLACVDVGLAGERSVCAMAAIGGAAITDTLSVLW